MVKRFFIVVFIIIGFSFTNNELEEKFNKAIKTTYEVENFTVEEIKTTSAINETLPAKTGNKNLFQIFSEGKLIGYAYLGQAPSKKKEFDYVVMFDNELIIKKSKVLIYRENYGQQIGTQRWLRQFIGMSPSSEVKYGENVAAISGATISASSMARAVNKVLKTMKILQEKEVI
ncbi:FMN-binding domain-containing protein [Mesonia phycicola]|uniref:FMN-binding domain-containing protein n=1 Tax=Mesonia phycicola TaxID=579105 RepID=A0A1M6GK46_9FLAO|nr:FMN-binding protein [Mesonia phycicola]SHJ10270.1 FMN-binding domain-containing protein [Mesonia phycicola]